MSEKYTETAAQTTTQVHELVSIAADAGKQITDIATAAANARELILEVQLARGEIHAARFGGQRASEIQGCGGTCDGRSPSDQCRDRVSEAWRAASRRPRRGCGEQTEIRGFRA